MADILNAIDTVDLSTTGQTLANAGDTLFITLLVLFAVIVFGGLIFFVIWWSSFKFDVKIKEVISNDGHFVIIHDKAKRKKKDGAEYWKLRRRKSLISSPPNNALSTNSKGRYYAECLHYEKSGLDAGYQWIVQKKAEGLTEFNSVDEVMKASLSQEERSLLADRIVRAYNRKSKSIWDQLAQITGLLFCIIIVISLMAFYGEISKNVKDTAAQVDVSMNTMNNMMKTQAEMTKTNADLYKALTGQKILNTSADVPLDMQVIG